MAAPDEIDAIRQITRKILSNRQITRSDQRQLMDMLLAKSDLSIEDKTDINTIFDRLHRGLLRVVD